jgi:hypothetical protein
MISAMRISDTDVTSTAIAVAYGSDATAFFVDERPLRTGEVSRRLRSAHRMDPAFGDLEHTTVTGKKPMGRPEVSLGHYLVGIEGREAGKLFEIGLDPLTIGRDGKQTLVFADDAEVSRVHARVSLSGNAVVVEDLGSTNGTFVNAKRITSPVTLREGNVLRVGRQILKYERRDRAEVTRSQELSRDLLRPRI